MNKSFDKHLNLFWNYNGNPYLEDNLTRAFIVTLSSLSTQEQINFINFFTNQNLNYTEDTTVTFDLQNPYVPKETIAKTHNKFLIGFNPSGKVWGDKKYNSILNLDIDIDIKKLNENNYKKYLENILPKETKELLYEIDENKHSGAEKIKDILLTKFYKGDARLDGWIFIFKNNVLDTVVGIETKLWDLDPFQLVNHKEKILSLKKDTIFKTFKEVCNYLNKNISNNKILLHFLNYMELLGHYSKTEKISESDFSFAFENNDYYLLNKKFSNFIDMYFSSQNYKILEKEFDLEYNKKTRRIIIKKIGEKNIGNIYFDSYFEKEKKLVFFIGTEIGVANRYSNEKFSKKINDSNFKILLNRYYPNENNQEFYSSFEILLRINQCSYSNPIYITSSNSLNDILNKKLEYKYMNHLTKYQCIDFIKKITNFNETNSYLKDKITILEKRGGENSVADNYNILSYLRFIDFMKQPFILEIDENTFIEKFHHILEKHIIGLKNIFDYIN